MAAGRLFASIPSVRPHPNNRPCAISADPICDSPTFDNAVKAAYSSQPAAPQQFADIAYSDYGAQYK